MLRQVGDELLLRQFYGAFPFLLSALLSPSSTATEVKFFLPTSFRPK